MPRSEPSADAWAVREVLRRDHAAMVDARITDLDALLAGEEALQREAGGTADYAEGVAAFVGKRKAVFEGR